MNNQQTVSGSKSAGAKTLVPQCIMDAKMIAKPLMKTFQPQMALALVLMLLCANAVNAESLWQIRSPQQENLFQDSKARNIGDLLTIVITEDSNVDSSEDRGLEKKSDLSNGFKLNATAGGGFGSQAANAAMNVANNSERKFEGGASFRSNQEITDRITVSVIDVLPNGNLVVSGQRSVHLNGDLRILVVSGIVRSIDISDSNSIQSRSLSDFRLEYQAAGPGQRFSKQGFLGRWGNALWPF